MSNTAGHVQSEFRVFQSLRYSVEVDGCTQKLTIPEVTLEDGGAVSYSIEKLSTEATLVVEGKH